MDSACLTSKDELQPPTGKGPVRPCVVSPLLGSVPHALLFDLTHDNESPLHKRSAEDALSTGALATFSYSAIGSVKGFDDLYPRLLNLVTENRKYEVDPDGGIGKIKRVLAHLHTEMVLKGYSEGHVHQENDVKDQVLFSLRKTDLVDFTVHRLASGATDDAKGLPVGSAHCLLERIQRSGLE